MLNFTRTKPLLQFQLQTLSTETLISTTDQYLKG